MTTEIDEEFEVEVTVSITTSIRVQAASPQAAVDLVNKRDYPLPPRDEWRNEKNWEYAVYAADGTELLVTP